MAGPATFAAYKLIRDLWPQKSIYDELYKVSPCLGIFKKDTNFGERIRYIGVGTSGPQGISSTFGTAKSNRTASRAEEFQVQKRSYYGNFSIEGLLWRTFEFTGNKAILVDPMGRDSKNLMTNIKNDLSTFLHGDGAGVLGRLTAGSTVSTATVTLRSGADIRKVDRGMALELESTGATGGTVRSGFVTVASVGGTETAPTITVDQSAWNAAGGIPAAAASDYIYRAGTYDTAPLLGLGAWLPNHAGSPAAFLGVTRTNSVFKLAGNVLDGTLMSPSQRIKRASRIVADTGGTCDTYIMSTRNWEQLSNELEASGRLKMTKVPAAAVGKMSFGVAYDAIEMIGPGGRMEVFADPWCPDDVERAGQRDTITIASLSDLVHWDSGATPQAPMLEDGADAREIRCVGDMSMYCEAPFYWCRVSVTAPT